MKNIEVSDKAERLLWKIQGRTGQTYNQIVYGLVSRYCELIEHDFGNSNDLVDDSTLTEGAAQAISRTLHRKP